MQNKFSIRLVKIFLLFCTGLFAGLLPAHSHEQKTAITKILFNDKTGNIEVSHRLNVHDAEHAVQNFWGTADLISDPEDMDNLALYVRSNFILRAGKKILEPNPVGHEIDGPYVWIYDELEIPKKRMKSLTIENYILRDVWEAQSNLVNIELGKFRASENFTGDDTAKLIELKKPKPPSKIASKNK